MRVKQTESIKSVQRRLEIERNLSQYPALPPDKISDLIHWFKREATAMEVASVARNPAIQSRYLQFHNKHISKMSIGETILVTVFAMVVIVSIAIVIAVP